jgi:hypothetical protein
MMAEPTMTINYVVDANQVRCRRMKNRPTSPEAVEPLLVETLLPSLPPHKGKRLAVAGSSITCIYKQITTISQPTRRNAHAV